MTDENDFPEDHKPRQARPRPRARPSLSFPRGQAPKKEERKPTSAEPKGPSPDVIKRIRNAKANLQDHHSDLDQEEGASPSRESPSPFARKDGTTLSQQSSEQYLKRGRQLINRYKREQNIPLNYDDWKATDFVLWLLSLKPSVKAATWRVYRQSAYHTLMGKPDDNIEAALDMIDNDILESEENSDRHQEPKSGGYRTSSMKEKKFPKKDFDKVMAYLQYKSRSTMAPILMDWLVASVHTGLRPIEWRATAMESYRDPKTGEDYVFLYVLNAKTTNGRGNGKMRTLDITDLPADVINAIKNMSEKGLSWYEDGKFGTIQSQVSQLLYKILEIQHPKRRNHYSLYSCRHQFIANMKTIMKAEEVSALSGHNITKTAQAHYGKARSSWDEEDFVPHAKPFHEEVARVRKTVTFHQERIEKLKQAGVEHGNKSSDFL